MITWFLNRALTNFRNEVNTEFPDRDKTSDGTIGDTAHQASTSDHNPDTDKSVDAWDMDVDLRSGHDADYIEMLKQLFQRHPAARYWIHNRRIAHRRNGWKPEVYTGANPHDKHVHWNSEQTQETNNSPWGVIGLRGDMDKQVELWITGQVAAMSHMQDTFQTSGTTEDGKTDVGKEVPFVKAMKQLLADVAEIKAALAKPVTVSADGRPVVKVVFEGADEATE